MPIKRYQPCSIRGPAKRPCPQKFLPPEIDSNKVSWKPCTKVDREEWEQGGYANRGNLALKNGTLTNDEVIDIAAAKWLTPGKFSTPAAPEKKGGCGCKRQALW